jgi:Uma2 family endonuclease
LERWNALSTEQQEKFAAISPDFVVELRSYSNNLTFLKAKMQEYINNGVKLGWLIDHKHRKVYIYHPRILVECLDNPVTVSGDPELPEFVLN